MHLTLGGHLTCYETVNGRRVAYHPVGERPRPTVASVLNPAEVHGVGLPRICPHGGFRFAATFHLLDGERANSHAAVACPKRR